MILYKYVTYKTGMIILENNTIAFSRPEYFNDPFESEAACSFFPASEKTSLSVHKMVQHTAKQHLRNCYGVLSLTRQPLNPLMWSHYAEEHSGMVIGIDVSDQSFTSEDANTIPVQYGNVIYTHTKPSNIFLESLTERVDITHAYSFDRQNIESYQRAFLYKASCWSYEEEVRVVKAITWLREDEEFKELKSGYFKIEKIHKKGKSLSMPLFSLPEGIIREVYLGLRSGISDAEFALTKVDEIRSLKPEIKILGCKISDNTWSLDSFDLEEEAQRQLRELRDE